MRIYQLSDCLGVFVCTPADHSIASSWRGGSCVQSASPDILYSCSKKEGVAWMKKKKRDSEAVHSTMVTWVQTLAKNEFTKSYSACQMRTVLPKVGRTINCDIHATDISEKPTGAMGSMRQPFKVETKGFKVLKQTFAVSRRAEQLRCVRRRASSLLLRTPYYGRRWRT
jgi:hypothetical protein